jgi:hypothetical protein
MPVTITAGITFSGGGLTMAFAPPSEATAGWWAGGGTGTVSSYVQRVTFATDTATASIRGPLTVSRLSAGAVSTFTYGWVAAGYYPATSTVERITFASDTSATSTRGPVLSRNGLSGAGNDSYGWFGGWDNPSPGQSTVDRITYANDTATASVRGPLSGARRYMGSTGTSNYGWWAGGIDSPGTTVYASMDRIDYANDTPVASVRGNLSVARRNLTASTDGITYGWFAGGIGVTVRSIIDRMTYATDTATATARGPLAVATYNLAGTGSNTYGYYGGGPGPLSNVQRITYATDTDIASTRGPLAAAAYNQAASAGIQ